MHFHGSSREVTQIYQIDTIITVSALPTHIVGSHASKSDDESTFVDQRCVIASCALCADLFDPVVLLERVNLSHGKGMTTVTSNDDS